VSSGEDAGSEATTKVGCLSVPLAPTLSSCSRGGAACPPATPAGRITDGSERGPNTNSGRTDDGGEEGLAASIDGAEGAGGTVGGEEESSVTITD